MNIKADRSTFKAQDERVKFCALPSGRKFTLQRNGILNWPDIASYCSPTDRGRPYRAGFWVVEDGVVLNLCLGRELRSAFNLGRCLGSGGPFRAEIVFLLCWCFFVSGPFGAEAAEGGNVVRVSGKKGSWELIVNGQPFYIKGVGVGDALSSDQRVDFLQMAREMGANAVRTWGIRQTTPEYLQQAHSYGLLVDAGFWLNPVNPDGTCSYLTDVAYREQVRAEILEFIRAYRSHPAILAWNIGNETIYWTKDEKERVGFCRFLEQLIQEVHQLDPDHPVIYTSAYVDDAEYMEKYVPSLDILGINVYGAVRQAHAKLSDRQKIPVVFTEFGPTGPWDLPKGENQRPQEMTDRAKAEQYVQEARAVFENKGNNLGGFAFYLGEISQISLTWWNINYGGSRKLAYIKLKDLYVGNSDDDKYPFVSRLDLSRADGLRPGEELSVTINVEGATEGVAYAYVVSTEIDADLVANPNQRLDLPCSQQAGQAICRVPAFPGTYRVYGVLSDQMRNYTSTLSRSIRVGGE